MLKPNRNKLLYGSLLALAIAMGAVGVVNFGADSMHRPSSDDSPEPTTSSPIAPSDESVSARVPAQPLSAPADPSPSGPSNSARSSRSPSEWTTEYHSSPDLWQFAEVAAPAAASGDARAQFLLAETLGECNGTVDAFRDRYAAGVTPDQIFEDTFWSSASRSIPAAYVELSRREFLKCAEFFKGHPPTLERIGSEATTREYWLNLALENGDPVAVMQDILVRAARLDTVPENSKAEAVERIEQGISLAVESKDPEALYKLSAVIGLVGSSDPAEVPAWTLAACQSGYDCSYANPAIGRDCVPLGLCSGGESVTLNMQQDLGLLYGDAYARSQEILRAFQTGKASSVADSVLAKLNLPEAE